MRGANVKRAAYNNALWCDAVCSAHDCPGEFHETLWINRLGTPRYYPDVVTLTEPVTAAAQTAAIIALVQSARRTGWSVKDSFHCLDLNELGFTPLFDAEWIAAKSPIGAVQQDSSGLHWRQVSSEADLICWEQAWAEADMAAAQSRVFMPGLLSDPDVRFVWTCDDAATVGGGILNRGAGVIGISNLFALEVDTELVWQELARSAAAAFPGVPLVAYDRGRNLAAAHRAGFVTIGHLRIWHRPPTRKP